MFQHLIFLSCLALTLGSPLKSRIVEGNNTDIADYPWHVSLEFLQEYICGGVIISENYILTAATCTDVYGINNLTVLYNTSLLGQLGIRVDVAQVIQNPNYDNLTLDYNLSILKLATPIVLSIGAQPVGLPDKNSLEISSGTPVTVTGFGDLDVDTSWKYGNQLQAVEVFIVSPGSCLVHYYRYGYNLQRMICAGIPLEGMDTCDGDLGGPLVANGTLYGIVSWDMSCGAANLPGVYTNVLSLLGFITENTGL